MVIDLLHEYNLIYYPHKKQAEFSIIYIKGVLVVFLPVFASQKGQKGQFGPYASLICVFVLKRCPPKNEHTITI